MSYRFMKVFGLRRSGCILLGSLGLLVGCEEAGPTDSLDAGVSTHAQRPGASDDSTYGTSGSGDTEVLSLDVSLAPGSTTDGQLSVDLEHGPDAGDELTLAPDVTGDPDTTARDVTSELPDTSEPSAPATSTGWNGTPDELPTSDETTYVDVPDTSTPSIPSTSDPSSTSLPVEPTSSSEPSTESSSTIDPTSTSEPTTSTADPTSTGETSSETTEVPIPPFPGQLTGVASWIDVPGYFQVSVPNVRQFAVEWSLVEVPKASRLTTADLADPKTTLTRFTPDASGKYTARVYLTVSDYQHVAEVSVEVAAVDVAFVRTELPSNVQDYPAYTRGHYMLSTERDSTPREVGCSYSSPLYPWARDLQASRDATIAFHYPRVPGDPTLFAYRVEYPRDTRSNPDKTHVATPESDCGDRRPKDMELAHIPTFDAYGKSLVYGLGPISRAEIGAPESKEVLSVLSSSGLTWWAGGNGGILWSGALDTKERNGVGFVDGNSHKDLGWLPHCAANYPNSPLEEIEAGADFFIGFVGETWSYYPFTVDGRFDFNCKLVQPLFQALPQAQRIHDVAIAPDGKTIAFIDERYDEQKQTEIVLRVGPVQTLLNGEFKDWSTEVLPPGRRYAGLQWIAGSEQVAFTELDIELLREEYIPYEAAIWRVNRDGSRRTEMLRVKSEKERYLNVTTGLLPRLQYNAVD